MWEIPVVESDIKHEWARLLVIILWVLQALHCARAFPLENGSRKDYLINKGGLGDLDEEEASDSENSCLVEAWKNR